MGRKRFHQLKRVKVRATWNKINLYNLSRLHTAYTPQYGTFYQQKWKAKSISRAYHGEHIREKQWQRMFTPRLNAVVPMDHRHLAESDGAEYAAGRGSGLDQSPDPKARDNFKRTTRPTPYMHQTYAPIERRLDMAIWRSLFASSARQARQFVVHGHVKVNGQKMPYPGYLLNPGDMFQVDPESVMFATGAPKGSEQLKKGRIQHKVRRRRNIGMEKMRAQIAERRAANAAAAAAKKERNQPTVLTKAPNTIQQDNMEYRKARQTDINTMITNIDKKLNGKGKILAAKSKQQARAFLRHAKHVLANVMRLSFAELEKERYALVEQYLEARANRDRDEAAKIIERKIKGGHQPDESEFEEIVKAKQESRKAKQESRKRKESSTEHPSKYRERKELTEQERLECEERRLKGVNQGGNIDPSKPYATPWRPRDYMSAFAFVPRYLEVHHKICSAVYLRHPVARPGLTEVPTPFSDHIAQLAFTWYLRRR